VSLSHVTTVTHCNNSSCLLLKQLRPRRWLPGGPDAETRTLVAGTWSAVSWTVGDHEHRTAPLAAGEVAYNEPSTIRASAAGTPNAQGHAPSSARPRHADACPRAAPSRLADRPCSGQVLAIFLRSSA
jgi:hypothetical protein